MSKAQGPNQVLSPQQRLVGEQDYQGRRKTTSALLKYTAGYAAPATAPTPPTAQPEGQHASNVQTTNDHSMKPL